MSIELSPNIISTEENLDENIELYPHIEDQNFNLKIATKEFKDTKKSIPEYDNIEEYSNKICNKNFELLPHQIFVKNFLSFLTPYNSLFLFHGLGSGKTCSAIGISETMRIYLQNLGIKQKIMFVASPNVQNNFKYQYFDENKLKFENNQWVLNTCVGNNLLKEIRASKFTSKKVIISQINKILEDNYQFIGYTKLSHLIEDKKRDNTLTSYFSNRLIIIDEVHNIRVNDDVESKKIANNLFYLVDVVKTIRLLLLSATPMYNSYKEIIWITNLMNLNDNRSKINEKDIFDKNGDFLINADTGEEIGKLKLANRVRGYISFVRGEDPFSFPQRIFPNQFDSVHSFLSENTVYPKKQFNNEKYYSTFRTH